MATTGLIRGLAQLVGAAISSITAVIWLAVLWLPSERDVLGHFGVVGAVLMLFFALLGVLAAHRAHADLMLGMFIAAFLPIGVFMLYTEQSMYRWIGLLNLIYLVAAIAVRATVKSAAQPASARGNAPSRRDPTRPSRHPRDRRGRDPQERGRAPRTC